MLRAKRPDPGRRHPVCSAVWLSNASCYNAYFPLMERAGKLLRKLKLAGEILSPEEVVRAAWPEAVGPQIARNTRVGSLKGTHLEIEASDPLFRQNLYSFREVILKNLAGIAGPGLVTSIRITVGTVRMPPRRAGSARRGTDEAEQIQDSGLRLIYRHSRKRVS